ncbi:MAG: hypothetical protein HRT40_05605 [Campylobacteraceae bacterium]|nr:hypothetical protein [Campylobacteraceae bacterium]
MEFFENWVELDLNPIISFSSNGKIIYSNNEAQFVLNRVKSKVLFDLALVNASNTYGNKTTYLDLSLENYLFYAITVSYDNDEIIHIKLYKSTRTKKQNIKQTNANITNVFTLVDLCISNQKSKSSSTFIKTYDPSIPEFRIVSSDIIKLLSKIYKNFSLSQKINTIVKLKTGEYIKVEGNKYSLVSIIISSKDNINLRDINDDYSSFIVIKEDNKITIDLPLILK